MKLSLERKVITGFAVALISVAGLGVLQYLTQRRSVQDAEWVSHTHDVLQELAFTRNALNRADSSAQSLLITGDVTYGYEYNRAIAAFRNRIRNLNFLTVDNAPQKQKLVVLETLADSAVISLQKEIDTRNSPQLTKSQLIALETAARQSIENVRTAISGMETGEWALLGQRNAASRRANYRAHVLVLLGSLLAGLLIAAFAVALLRDVAERMRAEQSLRVLSGRLLQMQEDERRHIGRELHDSLGQYLSALKMRLESIQGDAGLSRDAVDRELEECIDLAGQSIKDVRTASYLLYPALLDELGLQSAIPVYLDGFTKRCGIQTTFQSSPDFGRAPRDIELALFRILQESLTNVHRHSGSPTAHVQIARYDGIVSLEVSDAGKGMPEEKLEEFQKSLPGHLGVGLRGMHERMRQFGGKLEVSSNSHGTTVRVTISAEEPMSSPAGSA
jgi:signal transduction histidine kinase